MIAWVHGRAPKPHQFVRPATGGSDHGWRSNHLLFLILGEANSKICRRCGESAIVPRLLRIRVEGPALSCGNAAEALPTAPQHHSTCQVAVCLSHWHFRIFAVDVASPP